MKTGNHLVEENETIKPAYFGSYFGLQNGNDKKLKSMGFILDGMLGVKVYNGYIVQVTE